jgi:hypothetical protein
MLTSQKTAVTTLPSCLKSSHHDFLKVIVTTLPPWLRSSHHDLLSTALLCSSVKKVNSPNKIPIRTSDLVHVTKKTCWCNDEIGIFHTAAAARAQRY